MYLEEKQKVLIYDTRKNPTVNPDKIIMQVCVGGAGLLLINCKSHHSSARHDVPSAGTT